jgi:hypothetical protein
MTMDGGSATPRSSYLSDTRRRMARAIGELTAIERSGRSDLSGPLERLRKQQMASRRAGCAPVVHLCQALADCLALEDHAALGRIGERRSSASVVALLLDACWAIRLYADAVEKTAAYVDRRDRMPDPRLCVARRSGARPPK